MKKLFNKIWSRTDEREEVIEETQNNPCTWSFERNGWEASARRYNKEHNLRGDEI